MLNPKVFETPMMKQYMKIKKEYPDCLLFFRLGDFYEFFLEDAKIGAEVLDITLTARSRGKDGKIPMAGVPYHAVDSYLSKLVKAGHKVAICEQVSTPTAGELVDREVVRVVTPGTLLDQKALDRSKNNYVCSISFGKKSIGFAFADISTGDFQVAEVSQNNFSSAVADHFSRFSPSECILSNSSYNEPEILKTLSEYDINLYRFPSWENYSSRSKKKLESHFRVKDLSQFGLKENKDAIIAASVLLGYLKETQKDKVLHIKKISSYVDETRMEINRASIFNLELFSTIRDGSKKGSLLSVLDKTGTPMGARLMRHWIASPLASKANVIKRHDLVDELISSKSTKKKLIEVMNNINDIERTLSRVSVGIGNARDLVSIKESLVYSLQLKELGGELNSILGKRLSKKISPNISKVVSAIAETLVDEPPIELKQGGLIREGVSPKLDSLKEKISGSQKWLAQLEATEREKTKIPNLKVSYNKVFGYYIEISKSYLNMVPERYVRKQTLVNAERFITNRLKEEEEQVLAAEEKIHDIEFEIFSELVTNILKYTAEMQKTAEAVAELDCLLSFAQISEKNRYTRPNISVSGELEVIEGRHPVVETLLEDSPFVPNDTTLNQDNQQLIILTGPNMAGKSVYIRQVALIVLMSQMGCFVPAERATLPIVDKVFVRSGASDFISSGLSTFMVEMVETAYILNNATKDSLIIFDEVGRGTTTYDGVSLAWSICEFLVGKNSTATKTLFATHYHELQELENKFSKVKNFQALVKETEESPIFLHKIVQGGASHSYGVAVASLAGVPEEVTKRAFEILKDLESKHVENGRTSLPKNTNKKGDIIAKLNECDLNTVTPIEALNILESLKKEINDS